MALTEEGIVEVPGMLSRWVRLPGGAKAHYTTSGTTGPAVILLHGGLPGSSGTAGWRFMAPFLGDNGFRVFCPDLPGFGLSDTREEYLPRGIHDFVDFIHDFAEALCLDEFHIAGNSMGCVNSVNYMLAHPDRVKSFILIAGGVGDLLPRDKKPPKALIELEPYDGTREGMRRAMESIILRGEAVSDELVEMRYAAAERNKVGHAAIFPSLMQWGGIEPWEDQNVAARLSTKGRLDQLTIPGLYLYGKQDVLYPVEWGYDQEEVLPNVQFFFPDECGHQGQTDRPDLFNPVFLEFFRDGMVSRATADAAGVSKNRPENPRLVAQA